MNKKEYYILSGLFVFIFIAGLISYYFDQKNPRPVACTLEAKICPDGSAVGRIPPNCEFAPCPAANGLLGGDRDKYGCIPSAGYNWCEARQKCIRAWEEECEIPAPAISNFEECVRAGYPVMESYPRQCAVPGAGTFIEGSVETSPALGGDRDEHGCIGSAGYSWCEAKQKCLRVWEEPCLEVSRNTSCVSNSDCVPFPAECHPMYCVNKEYASGFSKPDACDLSFNYEAAYSADDCACLSGVCANKNIGRTQ